VSDRGHRRLQLLELSREPSRPFGAGGRVRAVAAWDFPKLVPYPGGNAVPGALSLDAAGRLYVVDTVNAAVVVFDERMDVLRVLRPPAGAVLPRWEAVAASSDGSRIYVADAHACRILAFDSEGKLLLAWGSQGEAPEAFLRPAGLAVDVQGFLHVSDALLHEIKTFGPDGAFVRRAGGSGTAPGRLRSPGAMAFWPPSHLFVDDDGNHLGQVFTLDGKTSGFFLKAGYPAPGTIK
jgi:sugar lactone lactonase YvrE